MKSFFNFWLSDFAIYRNIVGGKWTRFQCKDRFGMKKSCWQPIDMDDTEKVIAFMKNFR